ncbi:hypothetical protein DY000_02062009 [Brassica cretica]|uniref:Uncharacterized protein n=1 Tax=Brassica cretica TaxID=69181 RepID=A0ABQ7AU59_BRACR|nr:hypothetical protein DY000_02062009 [Brassica cretica]
MYKMTDYSFLIRFISPTIIDEVITDAHVVGQIRSVQGSDLTKETTRVVIRLLIDPVTRRDSIHVGDMLAMRREVRDQDKHARLKADLMENIWQKFGDEDE